LHSSRSNSLYWHDAGPSNPSEQSANDLVTELARLIDQKYGRPRVAHDRYYSLRSVGLARQHEHGDYFEGPHDEKKYNDTPHKSWRRGLVTALALMVWATVGTAGAYAFRTYYFGPGSTQTSYARSHAKQAQPGAGGGPPAAAASAAAGGYVVQVSAQRSKADAEASFRSLQKKFPSQLGGRTPLVRRADLGAKGIYYRTMVGPFASAGEADQFCGRFKAAGGQCIIHLN
jgi:SPOR domain